VMRSATVVDGVSVGEERQALPGCDVVREDFGPPALRKPPVHLWIVFALRARWRPCSTLACRPCEIAGLQCADSRGFHTLERRCARTRLDDQDEPPGPERLNTRFPLPSTDATATSPSSGECSFDSNHRQLTMARGDDEFAEEDVAEARNVDAASRERSLRRQSDPSAAGRSRNRSLASRDGVIGWLWSSNPHRTTAWRSSRCRISTLRRTDADDTSASPACPAIRRFSKIAAETAPPPARRPFASAGVADVRRATTRSAVDDVENV